MMNMAESSSKRYRPGPYWRKKAKSSYKQILRHGLNDFRSDSNTIGLGFADNTILDTRDLPSNIAVKLLKSTSLGIALERIVPFKSQVSLTSYYNREYIKYFNAFLSTSERYSQLKSIYSPSFDTLRGNCLKYTNDSAKLSHHYIELLSTLDYVANDFSFCPRTRYLEIGAGFGANPHLLIELFGIRKIICIDIAPNLYVQNQYLKSFYGEAVKDCIYARDKGIRFSQSDELEIYCLLPHQIEQIETEVDFFHNAHSFVEMPIEAVANYAMKTSGLRSTTFNACLVTYDKSDENTLDPSCLEGLFEGQAEWKQYSKVEAERVNYHLNIRG